MVSLNSTVSCGTMPIAARRLFCVTSRNVLAVDGDAAARRRRRSGRAAARWSTCRRPRGRRSATVWPAGTSKRDALEDRPRRIIGESARRSNDDLALGDVERLCARLVLDLGVDFEQVEHLLDIGQALADFAIDEADEIERHGELHQHAR